MSRSSKAEDVVIKIKNQILSGRWQPGDRLNDLKLAEEFESSRHSVREALFKLTETGIIEKEYWKGYFIKEITEDIVTNIVEIRIALESYAIRNFVKVATEADFLDMAEAINKSEKMLKEHDWLNYLTTDFSFHEIIYSRQPNKYIAATMNNYMLTIHFVRYMSMGKDDNFIETAKNSIFWHTAILEAIKSRDEEEAVKRLVAHLGVHKEEAEANLVKYKQI